jgi:hypothetical protein
MGSARALLYGEDMKWNKLTLESPEKLKRYGKKFLVYNPKNKELRFNIILKFEHGEWQGLNVIDDYPEISYYNDENLVKTFTHYIVLETPNNIYEV